jgi:L-ectoine synthase
MLIRSFKEVEEAGRVISISHGKSTAVRVLLKSDGLGFSLSEARCGAGNTSRLWYKNHWEANYVRAGKGSLLNISTGETWDLYPGVLYCVGPNDKHSVINSDDPLRIVSIFNPAIEGEESHDEDGAYPPTGDIPPRLDPMFVRSIDDVRSSGQEKKVLDGKVTALRMLTASDEMGFSLSDVRFKAGIEQDLWYKNHWEANLVLAGTLELSDKTSGETHVLEAGDVYCVGPNDPHHLTAKTDIQVIAIFNPPLSGDETHDEDGAYPVTGPIPKGPS